MIQPNDIAMLEKYDAVTSVKSAGEYMNGSFGTVTNGVFTVKENGDCFIYQKHKGDSMYTDFKVKKDEDIRVAILPEWNGRLLKVSPIHLADGAKFKVGSKYTSNANGQLVEGTAAPYLEVVELINYDGSGARVKIVTEAVVDNTEEDKTKQ